MEVDIDTRREPTLSRKKTRKNKSRACEETEEQRPSKTRRTNSSKKEQEEAKPIEAVSEQRHPERKLEDNPPWRNLQLTMSLQNKDIDNAKKVELAFNYVRLKVEEAGDRSTEQLEVVNISRVIVFLSTWVQSLLISSEKKIRADGYKARSETVGFCLDYRCWEIFKFCLEESLKLNVSLSFSRDFLRVIDCIARDVLSSLKTVSSHMTESVLSGNELELCSTSVRCVSLIFSSHGGILNENLDLWISTADTIMELVKKIFHDNLGEEKLGELALELSCVVLEPFAHFLRIHPTRKNGFHDFVDKLLEPLLHLLESLHVHCSKIGRVSKLFNLIEEIFCQGLFHPTHLDGFLTLQSINNYTSENGKPRDSTIVIKSYHRHLFDKLKKLLAGKNMLALRGIGGMFNLFVNCVNNQKVTSIKGTSRYDENNFDHVSKDSHEENHLVSGRSHSSNSLSAETRKALVDFFVLTIEPMLVKINAFVEDEGEAQSDFSDLHRTLTSANKILASFVHHKIYVRTEDTSEGTLLNFLKMIYGMVLSSSAKLVRIRPSTDTQKSESGVLDSITKELLLSMRNLVEIEYEVVGNDLGSLWLQMFLFAAFVRSLPNVADDQSVISEILQLGCQLVTLYSELRQVDNVIFSLCNAVRRSLLPERHGQMADLEPVLSGPSLCSKAFAESVGLVLSTAEFRLSIYNAVVSIPEGQVGSCIQQLNTDISESLEWLKFSNSLPDEDKLVELNPVNKKLCFNLQVELLGRYLSDIYALVLDSLTVTAGNSNLIRVSVKNMLKVVRLSMNDLVCLGPGSVKKFLSTITGKTIRDIEIESEVDILSSHGILLFFFRLYMSCRNLYRQALSLVNPDTSKKMSAEMGDPITGYSGTDLLEGTDWTLKGYFSWIVQPSVPLSDIISSITDFYKDTVADSASLIYVLNAMALQRLVDLNRLINSFQYILQWNENQVQRKLSDSTESSVDSNNSKKWKKCVLKLTKEATDLTDFVLEHLVSCSTQHLSLSTSDAAAHTEGGKNLHHDYVGWDFGVGALSKKSLPSAIWWIVCQNIDVWCPHATTKLLKIFLSLLIQNSLRHDTKVLDGHIIQRARDSDLLKKVTTHSISIDLLRDTIFYEQKFVRRYLTSRFCLILEKSVLSIFGNAAEGDLNSPPNWSEFLELVNSSIIVSGRKHASRKNSSRKGLISSSNKLIKEFAECDTLLGFLYQMPKRYLKSKWLLMYATYILNLERLVIASLLDQHTDFYSQNCYDLLKLFLSCRKVLKSLLMVSCEDAGDNLSPLSLMLSQNSYSILWLSKSLAVVVATQCTFPEDIATQVKGMIITLTDHTSCIFSTLTKFHSVHALSSVDYMNPGEEQNEGSVMSEGSNSVGVDRCLDSTTDTDAWKTVVRIAETLKEDLENLVVSQKARLRNAETEDSIKFLDFTNLSSLTSCFQGFLWGMTSAVDHMKLKDSDVTRKLLRWNSEPMKKLSCSINVFEDFVNTFVHILVIEDAKRSGQTLSSLNVSAGSVLVEDSSCKGFGDHSYHLLDKGIQNCEMVRDDSTTPDIVDHATRSTRKKRLQTKNADCMNSILAKCDSSELAHGLRDSLLHVFFRGEYPEAALFLRQLLTAASGLLRLNLQINRTSLTLSLVPTFISVSQVLLTELSNNVQAPSPLCFVWLDGILKYLEELGNHFPLTDPSSSRDVYVKLVELHLMAIGKCISLQGKKATLVSHDTESCTKTLNGQMASSGSVNTSGLDGFKSRLRASFKALVKKPSELHLLSAIQALERALVGLRVGCTTSYEIYTGNSSGGKVSSAAAAGIDCMDLVLEFVTGRKRLSVVKKHIRSLVSSLFNIILHLQGPLIFFRDTIVNGGTTYPDSGSVTLMCLEVLTKVFGKHALFPLDSCHIAQSLRIPAGLFGNFLIIRTHEKTLNSVKFLGNQSTEGIQGLNSSDVDRQFSIDLFAACCRLLSTVLKHYTSETEQCLALLEVSVSVLLNCLEMVDTNTSAGEGCFAWEIHEGVKCASFLRRIYEEIRQQKDVFSKHSSLFLSGYIWTYAGYGPRKTGLRREIDEALRPGIYALIDACSADDLQHLHTVFGEGPCRSTLASLQHDYKLNFQYEGKV